MADAPPLSADIIVDAQLSREQEDLILNALMALGVPARVRILPRRRSISDVQWLILAALPLQAFLTSIGGKVADDAYTAFQGVVRKILHRGTAGQASATLPMVLQDTSSGLQIVLDPDLPSEAYQQLITLDLSRFHLGPIHYDRALQRWRSELDEAVPR